MSNLPERPWTEEEKYTLLTEILKKAGVPSSHLVKMIRDFNITPSWADIPLPPGRSLNSCQLAFYSMCPQHVPMPVNPGFTSFHPPRHESSAPTAIALDNSQTRKRLLFPSDKPMLAPRAIQPRPTASTASFSSESGASALLSPGSESIPTRGEPPRKRGRPSKAESERRKAAAEARGETYPPPRRASSNKMKAPSTPTSPSSVEPLAPSFIPQTSGSMQSNIPQSELQYAPPPGRPPLPSGPREDERIRDAPHRDIRPTMRDLPRPSELRQALPSPHTLHLGHRETITRMGSGERSFEAPPPDRISFGDSSRRPLLHPRPDEPSIQNPELPLHSVEKRVE
ncbi:hypothetical protein BDV23DRAFT_159208 [Aspergillus alliaceus]|uniref:Uncharacterized protein n=2 Tax=Petromyces alliaceus TaxID=209559 RepID=A0A5N7C2W5_PETAA|nr:uncharacterized protein BDW43DRAFT_126834 [Aspergillus alliaceus]KAB8232137.1 hypothetical protein BDW43DRAFT_126834 [Aspergillus alliaceus]KAE8388359.1 hypothetical protein BDV23DRAFT_159208 [Aspergillus alliaceus]